MILWILPTQDTTHDLRNMKQMANKTDPYWKDRPGRSLPPDTCKCDNCADMHINSRQASLSLPEGYHFGITPATSEYTTVGKATIDLENDLLRDEPWNTDNRNSPHMYLLQ